MNFIIAKNFLAKYLILFDFALLNIYVVSQVACLYIHEYDCE